MVVGMEAASTTDVRVDVVNRMVNRLQLASREAVKTRTQSEVVLQEERMGTY
jgi:hypothetical protein